MSSISGVDASTSLPVNAIQIAVLMALLIPMVSSIVPIRFVLGQSLRDVLDLRRSKNQAVKFNVSRSQMVQVPLWTIPTGVLGILFAVVTFFIIPWTFFTANFQALLYGACSVWVGLRYCCHATSVAAAARAYNLSHRSNGQCCAFLSCRGHVYHCGTSGPRLVRCHVTDPQPATLCTCTCTRTSTLDISPRTA